MKRKFSKDLLFIPIVIVFIMSFFLRPADSDTKKRVVASYPYIGDLVRQIGGELVDISVLARGDYDPHYIVPRPSYIARIRRADLLIINGASLEVGWIAPLVRQANNSDILPGSPGFLDLSTTVKLIDVPINVSRASGDIHPQGNPHFYLSPANIPPMARAIERRLSAIDPGHADSYKKNSEAFIRRYEARSRQWRKRMKKFAGSRVMEYHKIFDYFIRYYGMELAGTIEPLPGIPPSAKHLNELIRADRKRPIRFIMQDVYHDRKAADYLAKAVDAPVLILPHDVGSTDSARDIFSLQESLISAFYRADKPSAIDTSTTGKR